MSKQSFNEAEVVVVKDWPIALDLRMCMDRVLEKYQGQCQRIVDAMKVAHPELDRAENLVSAATGSVHRRGALIFSSSKWPSAGKNWPTGLWVDRLGLENLTREEADLPMVSLWIAGQDIQEKRVDTAAALAQIRADAKTVLTDEELHSIQLDPDWPQCVCFEMDRKPLLHDLLSDDGEKFVATIVGRLETMAKFIPTLNRIFRAKR